MKVTYNHRILIYLYIKHITDGEVKYMQKIRFSESEVISYLEDLILSQEANDDEEQLYEEYNWNGKLSKNNYIYKRLVMKMTKTYKGE
jgi:hypothetical protein